MVKADADFIAACDPQTVLALCQQARAVRIDAPARTWQPIETLPGLGNRVHWFWLVPKRDDETYLDGAVTAFDVGCLKSNVDYWVKSEVILGFNPAATLYVDDDEAALLSAERHGIRHLYHRAKSSSAAPPQASAKYRSIESFHALMG